jgi:prepilin-type N-terminal cleavage/methylation domain-containing protein
MGTRARGFTLVELLVVLVIVLLVSILAIPAAIHAYGERSIQEAARLVHASIVASRDEAAGTGSPCGVRFLADPALTGGANRIIPMRLAPDYTEGTLTTTDPSTLPAGFTVPFPCLMVEQAGPLSPTNWAGNIRVGDQIQITRVSPWYTVVGPTDFANPTSEGFVQITRGLDRQDGRGPIEYLWLVNGVDDNQDGFADNGWDGIDNMNPPRDWILGKDSITDAIIIAQELKRGIFADHGQEESHQKAGA